MKPVFSILDYSASPGITFEGSARRGAKRLG